MESVKTLGRRLLTITVILLLNVCEMPVFSSLQQCEGTVSGTVGYVKVDRIGQVANDLPRARLFLDFKGKEVSILANDIGDYYGTPLECGEYRLKRVVTGEGKNVRTTKAQPTRFRIRRSQDSRFDVIVLAESPN